MQKITKMIGGSMDTIEDFKILAVGFHGKIAREVKTASSFMIWIAIASSFLSIVIYSISGDLKYCAISLGIDLLTLVHMKYGYITAINSLNFIEFLSTVSNEGWYDGIMVYHTTGAGFFDKSIKKIITYKYISAYQHYKDDL